MHHTFNGMDAPGDTQPDSQMHKQYTSGIYSSIVDANNATRIPKSLFMEHEDEDENDSPTDEIDVVESSQEYHNRPITSPTVIDVDEHAFDAQNSLAPTSPLKFETPGLAGRKRDSSGHLLSSVARTNTTPGTVASVSAFGGAFGTAFAALGDSGVAGGPLISLTQAFNNTQAPTSPAVGPVQDDVVFQRPSPNFTHARHSSPIPAYSSPIKAPRPETPKSDPIVRSSSEPRAEYVTLKQSQERRKHSTGDEHAVTLEHDSWDELSRQLQARKKREEFHRRAARSLSHISAPTAVSPRSIRKRTVNASYPSPDKPRAGRRSRYSDGRQEEDDGSMDELSQPMSVKARTGGDSDDEPTTAQTAMEHNSSDNRVQVPKTSSHPRRTASGQNSRNPSQLASPSSQLHRESQPRPSNSQPLLRGTLRPHSSKDSVAVMDSQPDVLADFDSIPPPKSLRFPSSPSTNQYSINQTSVLQAKTGYTSQVVSSSMPPMPPRSSPEVGDDAPEEGEEVTPDEERVPSSPPILTHDEDGEHGERTYDEYAEDIVDQDASGSAHDDGDAVMDDAEDLPVAKEESSDEDAATPEEDDDALDLVQPQKVDLGTDQEVPETLEQEQDEYDKEPDAESARTKSHEQMHRTERQNTVPETDALDETQPSFFPNNAPIEPVMHNAELPNQTNSTEQFQTAQEDQSETQTRQPLPHSSKDDGSDAMQAGHRIRSVYDIYDLPNTQQSAVEEDIEMPRLSGLDDEDEIASPAPPSAKKRKVTYKAKRNLIRSPVKAPTDSEPLSDPPSSPLSQKQQASNPQLPTASTQQQENKGATAATHAREEAQAPYKALGTLKSRSVSRPSKPHMQKKGALKQISKELLQSLSSPVNSPSKPKETTGSRGPTPVTPTRTRTNTRNKEADVDMPDADDEPDELAGPTPQRPNVEQVLERLSQRSGSPLGEPLVPNRVFASWPGSHYYPATCIGRTPSRQLRVRYDDGNVTTLDAVHVRALALHVGDHVKVDEAGMKKHTYIVVGFKDKIDDAGAEEFPLTDRFGHATVILEEKRRDSLPKDKALQPPEHISVPMASIYLTTGLWTRLRDRLFRYSPAASPIKPASRIGTPIAEPHATPSFTRRGTAIPSLLKDATARATSVASTTRSGSGTFSNMAFVLTSTAAEVDKEAIAKTIKAHGGLILEQGFHELFNHEDSDNSSSQSGRSSSSVAEESAGLVLKDAYKDLGFVALISDSHSRSTKYIQALALNVPCLHLRWVQDSLAASRAKPFMRYLLPAGVSKFLDPHGVVRSRTMQPYDPAADGVSFAQTIEDRDLLLRDQTVLLVTGKSKKEIEKRQPFIFLTHALGSASVGRCADLAAASEMLTDGHYWDWVYVDNGEAGVADAAAELFGTEKPASTAKAKKGKKRKREESEEKEDLVVRAEFGGRKIRVTCAEFVIQSLILGALIEE